MIRLIPEGKPMSYLSLNYAVFTAALLLIYYLFSLIHQGRFQWLILLLGSVVFYVLCAGSIGTVLLFLVPVAAAWLGALLLEKTSDSPGLRKVVFGGTVLLILLPLLFFRIWSFLPGKGAGTFAESILVPVGVSFYTLQLIAYVTDCRRGKIRPQRNPLRYLLFASFFPQIIQGPIPRYEQLDSQLFAPHPFEYENMSRGALKVVWGFFLKLMIADKAAVFVNQVFDGDRYMGWYIVVAAMLYALQLYTDFYACTSISQGVAQLFGIDLPVNFRRPYFALSVRDFWRRWHISLSTWLRDYVYIPLGGSRKGKPRRMINLVLVFLVSGLWHGAGKNFLVWGLLHAFFQIAGDLTLPLRDRVFAFLMIGKASLTRRLLSRIWVFVLVTAAWVFFRAADLSTALSLIRNVFRQVNPWALWGTELFLPGLDIREFMILLMSAALLLFVGWRQERGISLQQWFVRQHLILRWGILLGAIAVFWIFGTYGYGFDAQAFIYGGF